MNILNIRTNFASNSSSYHSTVFYDGKDITEFLPPYLSRDENGKLIINEYFHGFNWEDFILTSKDVIDLYLACQVRGSIPWSMDNEIAQLYIEKVFPQYKEFDMTDWGIDHQSQWSIPTPFSNVNNLPDRQFVEELKSYLYDNATVITGGNDNGGYEDEKSLLIESEESKVKNLGKFSKINDLKDRDRFYSYKDGDVWVLFDKEKGTKIRFSFKDNIEYNKSSRPELVDLIITNRCDKGCSFCYRDCTPDKRDALLKNVETYITALLEMNVLEIVIGGGDILTYPYLEYLCDFINRKKKEYNSVFNTTLNLQVSDITGSMKERVKLICNTFSGVALSYNQYSHDFGKIVDFCKTGLETAKISVQLIPEMFYYPVGVLSNLFSEIRQQYRVPLTLLGLKECGRCVDGNTFQKEKEKCHETVDEWIEYIKNNYKGIIGVDTQFLKNFPKLTKTFNPLSYTTEEGKFSCCIDAVENTISKSSYSDKKVELNPNNFYILQEEILDTYRKY